MIWPWKGSHSYGPSQGSFSSGDKGGFVPLYSLGCCVMLRPPRNEKDVITGKGAERRVEEFSCLSEQNKTCKGALLLPECPERAKARVSSSVSLAGSSSSHTPTARPRGLKAALDCLNASLDRYHGMGAVSLGKKWANQGSNGQILVLPAGEFTTCFFSVPFLLVLWQPSPTWELNL